MTKILPYSVVRQNLASVMDEACTSRAPITVTRRGSQPVVIMSLEEYNAMDETAHLTSNPANLAHLRRGLKAFAKGKGIEHKLIEPGSSSKSKPRRRKKSVR